MKPSTPDPNVGCNALWFRPSSEVLEFVKVLANVVQNSHRASTFVIPQIFLFGSVSGTRIMHVWSGAVDS